MAPYCQGFVVPLPDGEGDNRGMHWDIFCRVIDNYGDIGVCWRLCSDLAARGEKVRLWVDDNSALRWMAPDGGLEQRPEIMVLPWAMACNADQLADLAHGDVWVEGFGCGIPDPFVQYRAVAVARAGLAVADVARIPMWVNLEYLTAESFAARSHGLPSPISDGPARGWTKYFYFPGFNPHTGGLLREASLPVHSNDDDDHARRTWLARYGITQRSTRLISLFCYEPQLLSIFLQQLEAQTGTWQLLVTNGRAADAMRSAVEALPKLDGLAVDYLPALSQTQYDELLRLSDLNFVRGEDSLVRAIWAAKPMVWQIYPQHDGAHRAKLDAFLEMLPATESMRTFHRLWNSTQQFRGEDLLEMINLSEWGHVMLRTLQRLLKMPDLVTQLIDFVQKNR
jgi:uncharacterized repeat protein (TIGR03837 family)